ncbi:hypothetical protein ORV05_14100 [Amycolatopsis cynarae]|uniref:Uncharacterized protein n=1 Tax=Amycolatopsis cynarae TaxID=2995223 RepID=A0ABY7BBP7_9PSEU|nr:hypothetical protein [Amycolatopsis sp. HUAS 11-8]WAL68844.1 hypothetical protein ORV05_14100 [Amycolatopsis sp. HUAS 11-8]
METDDRQVILGLAERLRLAHPGTWAGKQSESGWNDHDGTW